MTKDDLLNELELAIRSKTEIDAKIEILKLRLQFFGVTEAVEKTEQKPKRKDAIDLFIAAHEGELDAEDIEFLRMREATTKEVARYLTQHDICEITAETVSRHISSDKNPGRYTPGPNDSKWKRLVDTVSVVRYHYFRCRLPNEHLTAPGRSQPLSKVAGRN